MLKMAWISLHSLVTVANLFLCFLQSTNNTLKLEALITVYSQLSKLYIHSSETEYEYLLTCRTYKNCCNCVEKYSDVQARWMGLE